MYRYLIIFFLLLLIGLAGRLPAQNSTCINSEVFCGSNVYTYPATVGAGNAEPGPDYGCLATTPNPAWFYMQILDPGLIEILITNHKQDPPPPPAPQDNDIDYICWGPFTSPTGACVAGLTADKIVSCSYSGAHVETCTIPNAQTGEFYILLITNYQNTPTDITFSQSNFGEPGAGSTNCNIVIECSILSLLPIPSACDPVSATFSVSGTIEFTNPPTTGTLNIKDNTAVPPVQVVINPPFSSPMPYTVPGIPCDGLVHSLGAFFTESGNPCEFNTTFQAPVAPCPSGIISGGGILCNDGTSTTTVSVSISGAPGPYNFTYAINGINQPPITNYAGPNPYTFSTNTPGIYTLVSMGNSTCNGAVSGSAVVTLVEFPAPPVAVNPPFYSCGPGNVILEVVGVPGVEVKWYTTPAGGSPQYTGNMITTGFLSATTVFYAEAVSAIGQCATATRTAITAEIRQIPSVTNTITTQEICSGQNASILFISDPAGADFTWTAADTPPGSITGFSPAGSSPVINEMLQTTGPVQGSVIYTVTPHLNQCQGFAVPFTMMVYPLPVPAIAGPTSLCVNSEGNFTTSPGMATYQWILSAGGAIIAGGGTAAVSAVWSSTGNQGIQLTCTDIHGCIPANPSIHPVTIHPRPAVTIDGNSAVCIQNTGQYTTQAGMSNYTWGVSSGGTISTGAGTGTIDVTWTGTGTHTVTVNYTDPNSCQAPEAASFTVTVNPRPVPVITGNPTVCASSTVTYTTAGGMNDYQWTVSSGGTIVSGSGTDQVTVTWNDPGNQSVSLVYTDQAGCIANTPTIFAVTVNPRPVPAITGPGAVCINTSSTHTTAPGKTNYLWAVGSGGTIVSGSGTNQIIIHWTALGTHQVTVDFTDENGCNALTPTVFSVVVNPRPVPAIIGPAMMCLNTSGNYVTEPGMTGYTWSVTPGGSITSGSGTREVTVLWTATGTQSLSVVYTDGNGCTASAPVVYPVTVATLPVPTLSGAGSICTGIETSYSTEPGMTTYSWTVTPGGTIVSGGQATDHSVTILWQTPGSQSVSVNYIVGTGCTAPSPTSLPVTVNPSANPSITAASGQACVGSTAVYSTQAGMTAYSWTVSSGGTLVSGQGTNQVTVRWDAPGNQSLTVNYNNVFGCPGVNPASFTVGVNPLPVTAITAQPGPVCATHQHGFQVPPDPSAVFNWSVLPAGYGNIASGQGTGAVTVDWIQSGPATLHVTGVITATGCTASGQLPVTVHPVTMPTFTPCFDLVTTPGAKKIILKGATPFIAGQSQFSGNRVSLNTATGNYEFDPSGASAGAYPVRFSFTNTYGCEASAGPVQVTVQNNPFSCGNALTDVRDGKTYPTAFISGRCWMTQNLNFGAGLSGIATIPQTDNCTIEKYCPDTDLQCTSSGGFYQWDELMDYYITPGSKGICPPEWHVPTSQEWQQLIDAAVNGIGSPHANAVAGSTLRDMNLPGGFHALLAGMKYSNAVWSFRSEPLAGSMFWTSDPFGGSSAVSRGVNSYNPGVSMYRQSRANAFNLRCIKD